jgi:tetratricopeptide (TPR) repeat protein
MAQGTGVRVPTAAIPACVALAVHLRTVSFGLVDLDDRDLLVDDRPFLTSPGSIWRAFGRSYMGVVDMGHWYFRPFVTASYAIDARWGGAGVWAFHLTNVALCCLVAALLCEVLRGLRFSTGAAVAASCVLAVHPALVPSVAWIPGRNDLLLAVFCLAAWIAFCRDRDGGAPAWRWLHFAAFAAALLTKETAFLLPVVCVAHALLGPPAVRGTPPTRTTWPWYVAGWSALAALRLALARRSDLPVELADPIAIVRVLVASLGNLALPIDVAPIRATADLRVAPGVAAALGLALAAVYLPGVRRRVLALGLLVFAVFALPAAAAGGSLFLDSRLVLPAVGLAIAVAELAQAAIRETRTRIAVAVATVAGLAAVSAGYEGAFRDPRSFALAAVAGSPGSALAHLCLGRSYQGTGDDDRALAEYEEALRLAPAEVAHNNIAVIYMKRGEWDAAERELDGELALNPRYARAYLNRAIVMRRTGRLDRACADARQAEARSSDPGEEIRAEIERDCR